MANSNVSLYIYHCIHIIQGYITKSFAQQIYPTDKINHRVSVSAHTQGPKASKPYAEILNGKQVH